MNNDLAQFSEERLKQMVKFCETSIHGLPKHFEASEVAALARIALSVKQVNPVYQIEDADGWHDCEKEEYEALIKSQGIHPMYYRVLFTTPQPAHTEQGFPSEIPKVPRNGVMAYKKDGSIYSTNYARGWNDCVQFMLAAAPKPESE